MTDLGEDPKDMTKNVMQEFLIQQTAKTVTTPGVIEVSPVEGQMPEMPALVSKLAVELQFQWWKEEKQRAREEKQEEKQRAHELQKLELEKANIILAQQAGAHPSVPSGAFRLDQAVKLLPRFTEKKC